MGKGRKNDDGGKSHVIHHESPDSLLPFISFSFSLFSKKTVSVLVLERLHYID